MDALMLAILLAGAPASAGSATVGWSTYLRAGPSETAEALDEVEHDVHVRVLGCTGRWCRVSTAVGDGFVDRDALDLPRVPVPNAAAPLCATAPQADTPGPTPTRFCSTATPGA